MEQTNMAGGSPADLEYYVEVHLTFGKSFELSLTAIDVHDAREKLDEMIKSGLIRWGDKSGDMDRGDSVGFDPATVGMVKLTRMYPKSPVNTAASSHPQPAETAELPVSQ